MKKPKCYKYPLYVPFEVYEFMISPEGVGSAKNIFGLSGVDKYFHNPKERHPYYKTLYVGWYKRKKDVITVLIWLIDWYHAAAKRQDGKCLFMNWNLICRL